MKNHILRPVIGSFPHWLDHFLQPEFDAATTWQNMKTAPKVNIAESKESFKITFAVPGMNKESFKIQVEKDTLTVSAEAIENKETQDEKLTRQEFRHQAFSRSFFLPDSVNTQAVSAKYENGLLVVTLLKKEDATPQSIQVEIQ